MSEKTWKEVPIGGLIVDAGNAAEYHTGDWRTERPIHIMDKCKHCMYCWICCPDSAVVVKDKKVVAIDYDYCKGCGICKDVCPFEAVEMTIEGAEE
jgi:pyruvate ferredoxin oxidoreductase delta subunit